MRTKTGKILKIAGGIVVALIALIVVASFVDSDPPDDSHLTPVDDSIGGENPLDVASEFRQIAISYDHVQDELGFRTIQEILEPELGPWDSALVEKALAPNRRWLPVIYQAVDQPHWQFPIIDPAVPASYKASTDTNALEIARFLLLDARQQYEPGNNGDGLKSLIASLKLAKRMRKGSTGLIHHVLGLAASSLTIQQVQICLATETDRERIQQTLDALIANEPLTEGFAESWRWEYQLMKKFVIAAKDGKAPVTAPLGMAGTRGPVKPNFDRLLRPLLLKKNMTLELLIEPFETKIAEVTTPPTEWAQQVKKSEIKTWSRYLSLNIVGIMLADGSGKLLGGIAEHGLEVLASYRLQLLLAAIRLYEIDHGRLPDSLNELVPNYLQELPTDPFDGAPLRYLQSTRGVFSIGHNYKKEGATAEPGILFPIPSLQSAEE